MKRPLSAKQRRFVDEFAIDFNATRAAERAGYSAHTARQMGSENLSKPVIRKAIDEKIEHLSASVGLSVHLENAALARLVNADIALIFDASGVPKPVTEWPEEFRVGGLVKSMKIRVEESSNGLPKVRIYSLTFSDRFQLIKEMGRRVGSWWS